MDKHSLIIIKIDKLDVINWLIEHFPGAFFKKANQVRPLKIGIFDDIIDFYERLDSPPFSKKSLREGVTYYSSSPAYLSSQKAGVARIDIYGNELDMVTIEQAKYAYQRYQARYHKKKGNFPRLPEHSEGSPANGRN
jgi:ProP effector